MSVSLFDRFAIIREIRINQEWWESFCCPAVEHWPINWEYVFARGMPKYVETEVTEPPESTVFHLGDTIRIKVHNLAVWGDTTYAWNEDYVINTSVPSKLGYRYEPDVYTFKPVELDTNWNFVQPADEMRHYWIFDLKIKENLVTKYFNPLKPDSARIVFTLQPADYANPDSLPNPISFNVEIRDKDSTLVYGPRPLTNWEQKNQVLYWDGKDNGGVLVDFEQGPFVVTLDLQYAGGKEWEAQHIRKSTDGMMPNYVFASYIEPIDDVQLRDYPDGACYEAYWDPQQHQVIVKYCYPFGDVVELYREDNVTKEKIEFKLKFNLHARVPPERVGAKLLTKCKLNIDRHGEKEYEWQGLTHEFVFQWLCDHIPTVDQLGKQKATITLEYSYIWPDKHTYHISSEEIAETLWVFFQVYDDKTIQDPPRFGFASYRNDYAQPNWFEYWGQIAFMEQPPFDANKARYVPELRLDQYAAYYIMEPKYYIYANCAYRRRGIPEDIIVVDTTGRQELARFHGLRAMVFLCYHENFHRTKFVEWWAEGGHERDAYANWFKDQGLPLPQRKDRDADKIPNTIEIELGLNPDRSLTNDKNALKDDFEWLTYCNHEDWVDDIQRIQARKYIENDWASPGNQTK